MSESHPQRQSRRPLAGQRLPRDPRSGAAKVPGAGCGPEVTERPFGMPRLGFAVARAKAVAEATAVVWESPGWR